MLRAASPSTIQAQSCAISPCGHPLLSGPPKCNEILNEIQQTRAATAMRWCAAVGCVSAHPSSDELDELVELPSAAVRQLTPK